MNDNHTRPRRDYDAIRDDVVAKYRELQSVVKVARIFSMNAAKVSEICREAGINIVRRQGPGSLNRPKLTSMSCLYCRHFSRTSMEAGYCLQHRRSVSAKSVEPCFKK